METSFSTAGEDILIAKIFETIQPINRFCLEFGATDGYAGSNIRKFINEGWNSLQFDTDIRMLFVPYSAVKIQHFTAENINEVFQLFKVPQKFDILSIDVDSNDYWLWKALTYDPTVVCIEYNSNFDYNTEAIIEYKPDNQWDFTMSYGASFASMNKLAQRKGYYLYAETGYSNLIFVKNEYKEICPSIFSREKTVLPHEFHIQEQTKKFVTD